MSFIFEGGHESRNGLDPKALVARLERGRITAGDEFSRVYRDYQTDTEHADRVKSLYEKESVNANLGRVGEALVFSLLTESAVGKHLNFRATHPYDDLFHGVDMIVEPRHEATPALATLDITINQEDIKGALRKGGPIEEHRPVGVEKKLGRIKHHIDYLAEFDPEQARNLSAWIESGGLGEKHTSTNKKFFNDAEQIFILKYYKTPDDAPEPKKPGYVIGGPQTVVSIDTLFINRALQGDKNAQEKIRVLSFLEFAYCVHYLKEYLDKKVKEKPAMNLFFDTYCAKTTAWSRILSQPELRKITEDFITAHKHDPEFRSQVEYYSKTLTKIFG